MRNPRSRFVAPAIAVLLLFGASAAKASSITVEFDLTSSTLTMLSGILSIPPDGTITAGTASVRVNASSLTGPTSGPAKLSNLALTATISGTVGGAALFTGGFSGSQPGGGAGSLTAGLANLLFGLLNLNLNGFVNCSGGICPALGTFPVSVTNSPTALTGFGAFGIGGLATVGAGTLNATLPINLAGNSVVFNLVGQEVSRAFSLPEPSTGALLGLGVLGMLGLGATRTRPS